MKNKKKQWRWCKYFSCSNSIEMITLSKEIQYKHFFSYTTVIHVSTYMKTIFTDLNDHVVRIPKKIRDLIHTVIIITAFFSTREGNSTRDNTLFTACFLVEKLILWNFVWLQNNFDAFEVFSWYEKNS